MATEHDDPETGFEPLPELPDPADLDAPDPDAVEVAEGDEEAKGPLLDKPEGWQAAVTAGLGVGLLLDLLVFLGGLGCGWFGHAGTCTTGPGLGLMLVFFVVGVVAGAWLLSEWGATDTGTTSFLSLGMTGIIALLFLSGTLDGWIAMVYIPALSAVTMLVAWLMTNVVAVSVDEYEE